ncbi:MAG: tetratricopeptide repeat protein [Myxococcales bacterium]|nr:tetratricopeptide repeat protein [Myxococcales bacterium]
MFKFRDRKHAETATASDVASASKSSTHRGSTYAASKSQLSPNAASKASANTPTAKEPEAGAEIPGKSAFVAASAAFAAGDYEVALASYCEAWTDLKTTDKAGFTAYNIAQCLRMLGHPIDAGTWYETALATGHIEAYRAEAMAHVTAGRRAAGAKAAEAELAAMGLEKPAAGSTDPRGKSRSNFQTAQAAYTKGDWATAAEHYVQAWLDPKSTGDRSAMAFNMAQCYRKMGDFAKAAAWYTTCMTEPGEAKIRYGAEIETKLAECQAAAGLKTDDARSTFEGAQSDYAAGNYTKALDAYLAVYRSPAISPGTRAGSAFNIAQCFRFTGNHAAAVTWYRLSIGVADGVYDKEIKVHIATCEAKAGKAAGELDTMVKDIAKPAGGKGKKKGAGAG